MATVAHGIKTLGVLGAGQMGIGITLVAALRAKVPVQIYDKSSDQITKGLAFVDKLLEKDVSKGRIQSDDAKDARGRIQVVDSLQGLRDVDMAIEVSSGRAYDCGRGLLTRRFTGSLGKP